MFVVRDFYATLLNFYVNVPARQPSIDREAEVGKILHKISDKDKDKDIFIYILSYTMYCILSSTFISS